MSPVDDQYLALPRPAPGLEHGYGDRVHLLSHPYPMSLLARLCRPDVVQPAVNDLVCRLYDWLLAEAASRVLDTVRQRSATRMQPLHPQAGHYEGEVIDSRQRVVVVDVARAGILPAHRFFHGLHQLVDADCLRQDHIVASRATDAADRVVGVQLDGSKIGGPVADTTVFIPDPMGATGTSISGVIRHYLESEGGPPRRVVGVHLIVTPEYLRRVTTAFPQMHVVAIRLDRGLSPAEVLATPPGTHWDQERGLNGRQYIVPGAGGVGEVLNNAWI